MQLTELIVMLPRRDTDSTLDPIGQAAIAAGAALRDLGNDPRKLQSWGEELEGAPYVLADADAIHGGRKLVDDQQRHFVQAIDGVSVGPHDSSVV